MGYEWFIGLRYLKAKRKQTFISIITIISIAGVMVGVMALIVVLSVMSGFEKTLKEKIVGTQAHLILQKTIQEGIENYDEVAKKVEEVKGVVSAAPFIISQVMLSTDTNVSGVVVKGIDPIREGKVTELLVYLTTGRLQDLQKTQDNLSGHHSGSRAGQTPRRLRQRYPPDDLSPRDDDPHGHDAQDETVSRRRHFSFRTF